MRVLTQGNPCFQSVLLDLILIRGLVFFSSFFFVLENQTKIHQQGLTALRLMMSTQQSIDTLGAETRFQGVSQPRTACLIAFVHGY